MKPVFILLLSFFALSSAWAGPAEGHRWEFNLVKSNDPSLIISVDLRQPQVMIAQVTCFRGQEIVRTETRGPVQYEGDYIVNNVPSVDKKYFRDGDAWCEAAIPVRRLQYQVIDADHLLVTGDRFFPNGTIWTKVD